MHKKKELVTTASKCKFKIGAYRLQMKLVLVSPDLGEFGNAFVKGRLKLSVTRLELREVGGERKVLLLE